MLSLGARTAGLLVLAQAASIAAQVLAEERLERYTRRELHMAVEFEVVLYASDSGLAEKALQQAMARIADLDKALSDYDPGSELSRLSATSATPPGAAPRATFPEVSVSDDLWAVLTAAQDLSQKTDGAFDVTVGPLTKLWRRARRQKELPEAELLAAARASVGHDGLTLDSNNQTARLTRANMRLDLGGIAKGYAAEQAAQAVRELGIARLLVRASGDIVAGDPPPGQAGWTVGIAPLDPDAPPERFIALANAAISTSGDARQRLVVDGRRYSHIIDPRTGDPVGTQSAVTVIAKSGAVADALASAVSVVGADKALALLERFPGAELSMVTADSAGKLQTVESPGFEKYATAPPKAEKP